MPSEKFIPTSKKLTWTITIFFIVLIIAVGIADVVFSVSLGYLISYVLPLESIIIVAYFGKSGMEHYVELKNQTSQITPQSMEEMKGGEV